MRLFAALFGAILILLPATPADAAAAGRVFALRATVGVDITTPASVSLGATFPGATLTGQLGVVAVRDTRGGGAGEQRTWVATVSATSFVTGAGGPEQTIIPAQISYWSGPAVRVTGGGAVVPGQLTSAQAVALDVTRQAFSKVSGSGNSTVEWNPTIRIAVPNTATTGTYLGTITHSAA
ncbi:hypothetical protein KBX06_04260 [Micromonospora sp. C31]|uniref:hypothetical protein n=1 Tax=Micromonospora sp. C31 TaxID=2824876 RepID=UPI001B38BD20|nr:hypothetical protein [Micromonospora sp. C31]MBQ1072383.1 hypothetical protein [Micromonospora sp. C31]